LKDFLVADELEDYVKQPTTNASNYSYSEDVIDVRDASFAWDREESTPALSNVNLNVSRGQLIAVVGRVGSGKSSLLNCLLGEMECLKGHVGLRGTVAYVPQQSWVQNETVRNNIVFGRHFDEYFYNRVLDACALFPDLSVLSAGDMVCFVYWRFYVLIFLLLRLKSARRGSICRADKSPALIWLVLCTRTMTSICWMIRFQV
jgi:hypothetical protein